MKDIYDEVVASYHRCRRNAAFFDTFYEIFLAKSPEIALKFARTDFARQKLMLKQSLLEVLNHYCGVTAVREELERLGNLHQQLDVQPKHYELWLEALCKTRSPVPSRVGGVMARSDAPRHYADAVR
ncbi:MAG: globin [Planctomycetales bacterium]|nr:globin [Planctomycetales bacterium]MBN8624731.1 globin [Planctomycetota bacterium]